MSVGPSSPSVPPLSTATLLAGTPPKETVAPATKSLPVMVMVVPPVYSTCDGFTAVSDGVAV